jgi:hypothetical protein
MHLTSLQPRLLQAPLRQHLDVLARHLTAHTSYKPYPCSLEACNAAFTQSSDLHRHLQLHFEAQPRDAPVKPVKPVSSSLISPKELVTEHARLSGALDQTLELALARLRNAKVDDARGMRVFERLEPVLTNGIWTESATTVSRKISPRDSEVIAQALATDSLKYELTM